MVPVRLAPVVGVTSGTSEGGEASVDDQATGYMGGSQASKSHRRPFRGNTTAHSTTGAANDGDESDDHVLYITRKRRKLHRRGDDATRTTGSQKSCRSRKHCAIYLGYMAAET